MTTQELIETAKEKNTIEELLRLVEQIAEKGDCSQLEALQKVEDARSMCAG